MKNRIISLLLASIVCSTILCFIGCSEKEIIVEMDSHTIYKEDGKYYMKLSEPVYGDRECVENHEVGFFRYSSMDELMEFLFDTEFSNTYNKCMRSEFLVSEEDDIVELFDVDSVQLPVFPDSFSSYDVIWYGSNYKFKAENDNEGISLKMHTEESFIKLVEKYKKARYSDNSTNDLFKIDGIEATLQVFPGINYKNVYYEHEENGRRIYVQEQYTDINAEAPEFVSMYVNDNGTYYRVLIAYPAERYTLEQLMEIKTEPYVPEEAE